MDKLDAPILQFVNAIKMGGIGVTAEQAAQGITYQELKDVKGNPFVVAVYNLDPDPSKQGEALEGLIPLLIASNDEKTGGWRWEKATIREISDKKGFIFGAPLKSRFLSDERYGNLLKENVNKVNITDDLEIQIVFGRFTVSDWQRILDNWEEINQQLDQGTIPQPTGFPYNWAPSEKAIKFAEENGMLIRAQNLLWGGDVPDSIVTGNFTKEDLLKILKFTTKVRVIKYNRRVNEWVGASETVVSDMYSPWNSKWGFWQREVGKDATYSVFRWAKEADPFAFLVIAEDHVLEEQFSDLQPKQRIQFFELLKELKQNSVPINGVDLENNLWIYNPPNKQFVIGTLREIQAMGYDVATPETTIITSDKYPIWFNIPDIPQNQRLSPEVKFIEQAKLFKELMVAYQEIGSKSFGLGGLDDLTSFYFYSSEPNAQAMIFNERFEPKPAYYALLDVLSQFSVAIPSTP